jgi:hypothetical protein
MQVKMRWPVLIGICLLISDPRLAISADSSIPHSSPSAASTMRMQMVAPLFIENGEFSSTLYMVNGLTISATAKVTLFDLGGKIITQEEVKFDPDTEQHVPLRPLLEQAGTSAAFGSLRVEPLTDHGMGILAQLAITHHGPREGYFDEELAMPSSMGSQMLRSVADSGDAAVVVSITNLSDHSTQNVRVTAIGEHGPITKLLKLAANQTELLRPCSGEVLDRFDGSVESDFKALSESSSSASCGISIASDGMAGELAAYGFAYHAVENEDGYFSGLTFSDPKLLRSAGLVYPGVPIGATDLLSQGNYGARVLLANFGSRDAHVMVQYATTNDNETAAKTVANITVPANSTKSAEFTKLTGNPRLQNSFVVRADTSPGVVLSKLISFGDGPLHEVEIIGKDEQQLENTGNHPWSVQDGVESTLILFNHAASLQTFFVKIGGDRLTWRKDYKLAPMETKSISINDLISTGAKDDSGKSFSKETLRGEVVWLAPQSSQVSGRILQSDRLLAMARNFSCGTCGFLCHDLGLSPDSSLSVMSGDQGNLGNITPQFCDMPCQVYTSCPAYSNPTTSGTTYYSWSGGGTVASLVSGGNSQMSTWKGMSPGYTTVNYSMQMGQGSYSCSGTGNVSTSAAVTISQQTTGFVAMDNAAYDLYDVTFGTTALGVQAQVTSCFAGMQFTGAVNPSTYTSNLTLKRNRLSYATYIQGSTLSGSSNTSTDDTSTSNFRDDNPQSGGSNGKIYDVDGPGASGGTSSNGTYRFRANFSEYAVDSNGITVSTAPVNFFVRVSCSFDSGGNAHLVSDVPNDNQIGTGTTKTSWNLQ